MNDQSINPAGAVSRASEPVRGRRARRILVPLATMLLGLVAVVGAGGYWYLHHLDYVEETDARIVSEIIALSSRVEGWVVEMGITEGSRVARDQILVKIDDRQSRMRREELGLGLQEVLAEHNRIAAEIEMVDARTQSRYASEQSELEAARRLSQSFAHELRYAEEEFQRAQSLSERGVIPVRALDLARTAYLRAQQEHLRAQAQVASAEADLREAEAAKREIEVLKAERKRLEQRSKAIQVQIDAQALDIADRSVRSPIDGVVSRTFVAVGEYVTPGQRIALLHNPQQIWVEALLKETEVRRVKVGQPVAISVDAYPDRDFKGVVERIGHAATSEFSLLPTPNPSGNFTKVTQRIPIRVTLEQSDDLLKPGMMVEVSIDVRGD